MNSQLREENALLRNEIQVLHQAAEITANLVIQQFELTEQEKQKFQEAAINLEGFKRSLDQTSDCVFMFDPETFVFNYVNQGGINHTGYEAEELFSMTFADLGTDYSPNKLHELFDPLVANPNESLLIETVQKRKNGVDVPVEIFAQYIVSTSGKGRFFSIVRNITKRLLEEKEREQMQTKMLQAHKLESVGELAAGIAHEINTPIQYISTNLTFMGEAFNDLANLLDRYQAFKEKAKQGKDIQQNMEDLEEFIEKIDLEYLKEELPEAIRQADEGSEKVRKLVLAMKEFSHPGSTDKLPADINRIIKTTLQIASNEYKYIADIETDLESQLPQVECHQNEIGQVMLNIIINAAHSIEARLKNRPDTDKGLIKIRTCSKAETIVISITDNGCGIPIEIINRIFDPFFTTKEVGKGTGQGLAIARDVVQNKHQGEIAVSSAMGRGTTFTISLPRIQPG